MIASRAGPPTLRLYRQALQVASMGGWECDLATERLRWTEGVYRIYDIDPGCRLRRRDILALYTDASRQQVEAIRGEAIRRHEGFCLDTEVRTAAGDSRWVRITAAVAVEHGQAVRIFGAQQDVTAERATWDRLRAMAERDPLTGLANRAIFDARYHSIVNDPSGHAGVSALIMADLDRFKAINDRFGHAAGDECLRQVAQRLQRLFPDADLIARLGGDEFALLLRAPLDAAALERLLTQATDHLRGPVLWKGRTIDVALSLGGALVADRRRPRSLFERADAALYAAKAAASPAGASDRRARS